MLRSPIPFILMLFSLVVTDVQAQSPWLTTTSANGLYSVTIRSKIEPIPVNQMHGWVVHIETNDGQPVDGAMLTVDGGMQEHDHGLPSKPRVTQNLEGGNYLVEGMKFHMGGAWQITFLITRDGETEPATIEIDL